MKYDILSLSLISGVMVYFLIVGEVATAMGFLLASVYIIRILSTTNY